MVGADTGRTQLNCLPAVTDLLHAYDEKTRVEAGALQSPLFCHSLCFRPHSTSIVYAARNERG